MYNRVYMWVCICIYRCVYNVYNIYMCVSLSLSLSLSLVECMKQRKEGA